CDRFVIHRDRLIRSNGHDERRAGIGRPGQLSASARTPPSDGCCGGVERGHRHGGQASARRSLHPPGIDAYRLRVAGWALSLREWGLALIRYGVGALGWGLYIGRDPALFIAQFTGNMRNGSRLRYLGAPWGGLWNEFVQRYLGNFGGAAESAGLS